MNIQMTIETYTKLRDELQPLVDTAGKIAGSFPKGNMGLTIRTPESIEAKCNYDILFSRMRKLNGAVSNKMKRQYHKNKNGGHLYSFMNK